MGRQTMATSILRNPTLADNLLQDITLPKAVKLVGLALIGSALIAISAHIQVPFWPVPVTMQTFAVLVVGMAYGWRLGGATILTYLAQGAAGLPVFAKGAGLAYFAGPTTGYLIGFVVAAMLVGWLAERNWDRSFLKTMAANAMGTAIIFTSGFAWLSLFLANAKGIPVSEAALVAFNVGVTPFLIGAAAKIALATAVLPFAWKLLGKR